MVILFILLFLTVFPGYYLGKIIYRRDVDKEPKKLLMKIVVYGALICIPAAFVETYIENSFTIDNTFASYLWYFTIGIALVEEIAKFIPVYRLGLKSSFFDDIYDAIVYTSFSSLGFATFENIFYVFGESGGIITAIIRLFFSVPGHIGYGVLMGYFIGIAYNEKALGNNSKYKSNMFLSILIPTLFHGIYDALISFGAENCNVVGIFFAFVIDLYLTLFAFKHAKVVSNANEKLDVERKTQNISRKIIALVCFTIILGSLICYSDFLNWA